ncbi:unnamed protein product [Effrenium voratum]|nr:unnamed protein product [Effrenium voratum]
MKRFCRCSSPQQIIDQGLVPVLVNTHDAKRLASIINLVDKEVLLHLLRHVDGEKLAQLVNDFEEDKDFFADGPIIRLLQEASKDYKLLQDKVAPLMQRVDAVKTVRLVSGVQPSKLLEVLRQVDCPTALILMSNANENFVVNMLCGPLDGLVSATAPGVAEVMKLNARIAAAFRAERPDQAAKLLDPVATQEMAVIAQAALEAQQVARWVEQLDEENRLLKEQVARCEAAAFSFNDDATGDTSDATLRRKGLALLLELGDERHKTALAVEQARGLLLARSGGGKERRLDVKGLEEYWKETTSRLEELEGAQSRQRALEMQLEMLQQELCPMRDKANLAAQTAEEEHLRYDALVTDRMREMQLEQYQLEKEAAVLTPKLKKLEWHGAAMKVLGRAFKFMKGEGFLREILWRWRFLLPP